MGRSRLTGETVVLANVSVDDILDHITNLATEAGYVEEPALMAA